MPMQRYCPKRSSLVASLSFLATVFLLFSQAYGGTIYENFDNNQFNSDYFFIHTMGTGPSAVVASKRLEITIPADSSGTNLFAAFSFKNKLSGDFDVQVDFDLIDWPGSNGIKIGINTDLPSSVHRASLSGPWEGYYLWINGSNTPNIPSTDALGKLRMTRTGNKIEGFYWQNNAWHSMGSLSDVSYGKDILVNISAGSGTFSNFSGQMVKVAFDNFRITNKNIPGATTFLPLLLN